MSAIKFIERVMAWPAPSEVGYVNIHWVSRNEGDKKGGMPGKPCKTPQDFMYWMNFCQSTPTIGDIYFCLSTQKEAAVSKRGKALAKRNHMNSHRVKALWIDVDVKPPPKGYATF